MLLVQTMPTYYANRFSWFLKVNISQYLSQYKKVNTKKYPYGELQYISGALWMNKPISQINSRDLLSHSPRENWTLKGPAPPKLFFWKVNISQYIPPETTTRRRPSLQPPPSSMPGDTPRGQVSPQTGPSIYHTRPCLQNACHHHASEEGWWQRIVTKGEHWGTPLLVMCADAWNRSRSNQFWTFFKSQHKDYNHKQKTFLSAIYS